MVAQNVNLIAGLPLNIYIVSLTRAGGLDGSAIFILNQALNDIFFMLPTPLYLLCSIRKICFLQAFLFFNAFCLISRNMFQCCVSLDRYLAVVHPVVFRKYRDLKYRLVIVVPIWTCSLIFGVDYIIYFQDFPYYILGFVESVILSVMTSCCVCIWRVLRRPGPGIRAGEDREAANAVKKRAFTIVYVNLLMFLMQNVPLTAAFFIFQLFSGSSLGLVLIVCFDMYITAGFVQTLLFLYHSGKRMHPCRA